MRTPRYARTVPGTLRKKQRGRQCQVRLDHGVLALKVAAARPAAPRTAIRRSTVCLRSGLAASTSDRPALSPGLCLPTRRETSSVSCARRKHSSDEARHQEPQTDPVRGVRVLRLRDMQRDCAVICLPLQHYFQLHYCQSCNRPVVMEPHDGSTVCPECGHRDAAVVKPPFIITVPPFRERPACSPRSAGRGCYRVLRRGTVTVAQ
jgi:DNA-directed RNA polymerase subunit RPC12/RpoP